MATKAEKAAAVEALAERLEQTPLSIVAGFTGLQVRDMQTLRRRMRESGATFRVVKNTLASLAAKRAGIDGLEQHFAGQSGIAFGGEDVVAVARALRGFARRFPTLEIRVGVLEGGLVGPERVSTIAGLPGPQQLRAELVGALASPVSGLVYALDGLISGLVYALQGRLDQLEAPA